MNKGGWIKKQHGLVKSNIYASYYTANCPNLLSLKYLFLQILALKKSIS